MTTVVHHFFRENLELKKVLESAKEVSLLQTVKSSLSKSLALAVGSYFENEVTLLIEQFANKKSHGCAELVSLVKIKALTRQYHTLFDWEKTNANKFFSLFGEDFKKRAEEDIKNSNELKDSIKSFLELGELRNKVVHQNYASFTTDKTSEEIFSSFEKALFFVEYIKKKFE